MPAQLWIEERPARNGDDGASVVVLVHGSMDRSASFARVAAELRDDHHVVRYDRRGYGRSRAAGATSIEGHVDDLIEVVAGRPATLVGHSLGGVLALAAAQRRPDLVRSVFVYEAPMMWLPWWPANTAGAAAVGSENGNAAEAFMRRMIGDAAWEALPERTKADRRAESAALMGELLSARTLPAPYDPALVSGPVVIGQGSKARPHHVRGCQTLATAVGTDVHVIDGAAHGGHRSHPEAFAELIRTAVLVGTL